MRLVALVVAAQLCIPGSGRVVAQAKRQPLDGVWSFSTLTPLERPPAFSGRAFITESEAAAWVTDTIARDNRDRRDGGAQVDVGRAVNDYWFDRGAALALDDGRRMTSLIVDPADGRLPPPTDAARERGSAVAAAARQHPADGPEDRSLQERCLSFNAGPPMLPGLYNNYVQILETAGYVVIFNEMIHEARVVPLDNRARPPASVRRWQGEPRGRWDGPTLVVDSTNFLGPMNLRGADDHLHLVERFTRIDEKTLRYEFTVDDPTAFARPWTARVPMTKVDDRMFEYACHEGNYALRDILSGARFEEGRR